MPGSRYHCRVKPARPLVFVADGPYRVAFFGLCEGSRVVAVPEPSRVRQVRMAARGDRKWVVALRGEQAEVLQSVAFDLADDPSESLPIAASPADPDFPREFLEQIANDPDPAGIPVELQAGMVLQAPKVSPDVSAEELTSLRALGYAE